MTIFVSPNRIAVSPATAASATCLPGGPISGADLGLKIQIHSAGK